MTEYSNSTAPLQISKLVAYIQPRNRKSLAHGLAELQLFQQTQLSGISVTSRFTTVETEWSTNGAKGACGDSKSVETLPLASIIHRIVVHK